jgi:hypothetical protein
MIEINQKYIKGIVERFKHPIKIKEYSTVNENYLEKNMIRKSSDEL